MYLRISDIAGSSRCAHYLESKLRRVSGSRGGSSMQGFSQELGTAVHELVQYVLSHPPELRQTNIDRCGRDLEALRINLTPTDFLKSALPRQFFEQGLRIDKMMSAWEHGAPLLRLCSDFLDGLEARHEGSINKWVVEVEVSLHSNAPEYGYQHLPASTRSIFGREVALHGSVDLVFRWRDIRILAELKTGKYSRAKEMNWRDQIGIYLDVWKEKHPDHRLYGVVFHASRKPIYVGETYPFSEINNSESKVGGPQCNDCFLRTTCDMSIFHGRTRYY